MPVPFEKNHTYQDLRPKKTAEELRLMKLLETQHRQLKASQQQLTQQKESLMQVMTQVIERLKSENERLKSENERLKKDNKSLEDAVRYGGDFQQCILM